MKLFFDAEREFFIRRCGQCCFGRVYNVHGSVKEHQTYSGKKKATKEGLCLYLCLHPVYVCVSMAYFLLFYRGEDG